MVDTTERPRISVVIPSYNGAKRIPNILAALAAQTVLPYEVILSIDGSTDDSEAVARGIQMPCSFIIHVQPNGGRATARNRGARQATGDILFFMDDDMRPTEGVIAAHYAFHSTHSKSYLVGGQHFDPVKANEHFRHYVLRNSIRYLLDTPAGLQQLKDSVYITAAHLSIDANLFWSVGGFDERLTDLEDLHLCLKLRQLGYFAWRDESMVAWHDSWDTPRHIIGRQREYAAARQRLFDLQPELLAAEKVQPLQQVRGLKRIAMSLLARRSVLRRIGKAPFTWLPKGLRYKLYDYIIYGLGLHFTDRPYS